MNLDDLGSFYKLDSQGMFAQVNCLPGQLEAAYALGMSLPLPECARVRSILIAGLDGAVAGADMLVAWASERFALPVYFQPDGTLPVWAKGEKTLVVAISNSGDTRETLALLEQAAAARCPALALTGGGEMAALADRSGINAWVYPATPAPGAAVGWTFGLLLSALHRLGWLEDPAESLREGLHAMRNAQMNLLAEVPVVKNPAKRLAGQMMGRWISIFTAGYLSSVARRWKSQLNLVAKTWAQVEPLPQANYSSVEGLLHPVQPLQSVLALFLRAPDLDEWNAQQLDRTRQYAMQQGINTDVLDARGHSRFARLWTGLLFADYTATFLAMAYGVDPSLTPALDHFKP